jgi:hypothetical protein
MDQISGIHHHIIEKLVEKGAFERIVEITYVDIGFEKATFENPTNFFVVCVINLKKDIRRKSSTLNSFTQNSVVSFKNVPWIFIMAPPVGMGSILHDPLVTRLSSHSHSTFNATIF